MGIHDTADLRHYFDHVPIKFTTISSESSYSMHKFDLTRRGLKEHVRTQDSEVLGDGVSSIVPGHTGGGPTETPDILME